MIVLLGESASGKDSVLRELIRLGYKRVVTYTTRTPREGEVDGVDYYFLTKDKFKEMESKGIFSETTSYNMKTDGEVFYGSVLPFADEGYDKVMILNPDGLTMAKREEYSATTFYLDVDKRVRKERLKARGDDKKEYARRLKADNRDFKNIHQEVDYIVKVDKLNPAEIAMKILSIVQNNSVKTKNADLVKGLHIDKPHYEKVIYVAHKFQNNPKNADRIANIVKRLIDKYPSYLFVSPIHSFEFAYDHVGYQKGLDMCFWLLSKSDAIWVFDDYDGSVGVNGEIAFAKKHEISIKIWDENKIEKELEM